MDHVDQPELLPVDREVDGARHRRHGHARPDVIAVIALGGALGAAARYGVGQAVTASTSGFPWATFLVNISGSFALGLFLVVVLEQLSPTRLVRPFFATGFVGSFTTFSTFAVETSLLVKDKRVALASVYWITSLAIGLFGAWLGMSMGRLLPGAGRVHQEHR